jgi:hypothetical protein
MRKRLAEDTPDLFMEGWNHDTIDHADQFNLTVMNLTNRVPSTLFFYLISKL